MPCVTDFERKALRQKEDKRDSKETTLGRYHPTAGMKFQDENYKKQDTSEST